MSFNFLISFRFYDCNVNFRLEFVPLNDGFGSTIYFFFCVYIFNLFIVISFIIIILLPK